MTGHLDDELSRSRDRITVETQFGRVTGGRANNGSVIFLEIPFALPPKRFQDPVPLPKTFRYEDKLYTRETAYCTQPLNDGQAAGSPFEDKVGYGNPTENPLFLNIAIPPSFPARKGFPVKVYIHGGFLQFGSPHSLSSQAQYIAAQRSEIWINIGYRLSAFGFLASDKPNLTGNYGFKDQWLALQWIKENVHSFGGNADDITLSGLSAGAHSVHQILHHVAFLPATEKAPFHSACLQSNGILIDPKTPAELRPQFAALCRALKLDPDAANVLEILRDPAKVPWKSITSVIETDQLGIYGTFRGCLEPNWMSVSPGPMEFQRSGQLARRLKARGVRSIVIGDLKEEWYLYSSAHPIKSVDDVLPNVERYFPTSVAKTLINAFPKVPKSAAPEKAIRLYGEVMSCLQVHLPVRQFVKDFEGSGLPVLRYEIRWTPEQHRPFGYVTHGGDRVIWALREPSLRPEQLRVAKEWLDRVEAEVATLHRSGVKRDIRQVLTLLEDKTIGWKTDERWEGLANLQAKLDRVTSAVSPRL